MEVEAEQEPNISYKRQPDRDRLLILLEMLKYCKTPQLKTHIMMACRLNYYELKKFLQYLVDRNLLFEREQEVSYGKKTFYTTSQQGRMVLEAMT